MIRILDLSNRFADRSHLHYSNKNYYAVSTTRNDARIDDSLLTLVTKKEFYLYVFTHDIAFSPDVIIYSINKYNYGSITDLIANITPDIIIDGFIGNAFDPTTDEYYNQYEGNKIFYKINNSVMTMRSNMTPNEITTVNVDCDCHANDNEHISIMLTNYLDSLMNKY